MEETKMIGIFDSGVGGLTVFKEISTNLPHEDIIYLGDTKQFPYGNKSKETIVELTQKNIEFLINKNVDLVVIACGTATSQSLEEVKNKYQIPIIGIIEPTILELQNQTLQSIGVIATTGTIRSNAWEKEIKKKLPQVQVINKACPLLAQMAEEGWTNNQIAKYTIAEYLNIFHHTNIQKLILGCTHYPLFTELIQKELGEQVEIINTGKNVAKYLKNMLKKQEKHQPQYEFYLTDLESEFLRVANNLLQQEIEIKLVT